MGSAKEPLAPELVDERQKTDESLHEERTKVDALLEPPDAEATAERSRAEAAEALENERERVDTELERTARKTVVEAVAAERERADETIAVEREHADELQRREQVRSALESLTLEEERRRTDQSLETERGATDQTIVAQTERLQIVSHDLKNPLQSIVSSAAALKSGAAAGEALDARWVQKAAERIERGARTMDRLIVDLLTSTSLELGALPLTLERREVAPIVDEVMKTFESHAAAKQVGFTSRAPDVPLWLRCDAGRVTQAVCNVVANAIKFTPAGAAVEVVVERVGDEVQFRVLDGGPGVPEKDAPRIFDRHFRGTDEPPAGLGLGLYIAKTIVDLHGGRIWFEPRKDAPGSVFTITLPLVA